MAIVIWNLRQVQVAPEEVTCLLAEDMIYNPSTPEHPMVGVYYPEDDITIEDIEARLDDYRNDRV
jgi:hypothetical protein